jgi:hypothetical protein
MMKENCIKYKSICLGYILTFRAPLTSAAFFDRRTGVVHTSHFPHVRRAQFPPVFATSTGGRSFFICAWMFHNFHNTNYKLGSGKSKKPGPGSGIRDLQNGRENPGSKLSGSRPGFGIFSKI